jgi:hypothetical protein
VPEKLARRDLYVADRGGIPEPFASLPELGELLHD